MRKPPAFTSQEDTGALFTPFHPPNTSSRLEVVGLGGGPAHGNRRKNHVTNRIPPAEPIDPKLLKYLPQSRHMFV